MNLPVLSPAAMGIVEWLGAVGPRWGFPKEACRVHGVLYLLSQPVLEERLSSILSLERNAVDTALNWLVAEKLASEVAAGWTTEADPWALMTQALETRRSRELPLALEALRAWQRDQRNEDPMVVRQAMQLMELVEDIAAIDAGAQRLGPGTLRRIVGVGGRAARLLDRTLGGRGKRR